MQAFSKDRATKSFGRSQSLFALLDQALYSIINILLIALVARNSSAAVAGEFAAMTIVHYVALVCARCYIGTTMLIECAQSPSILSSWLRPTLLLSVLFGAVSGLAAWQLTSFGVGVFFSFSLATSIGILYDGYRHALLASARFASSAMAGLSALFGLAFLVYLVPESRFGLSVSVISEVLLWSSSLFPAIVVCHLLVFGRHVTDRDLTILQYRSQFSSTGTKVFIEQSVGGLSAYAIMAFAVLIIGAAEVGAIRIGQAAAGPVAIVVQGLTSYNTRRLASVREWDTARLVAAKSSLVTAVLSIAGLPAFFFATREFGGSVFGPIWERSATFAYVLWVVAAVMSLRVGAVALLRTQEMHVTLIRARVIETCCIASATLVGAAVFGAPGFVYGTFLASVATTVIWIPILGMRQRPA